MNYTIEQLDLMEGHDFEYAVAELLRYNGWRNVEVTQGSGDYGIDILARRMNIRYAIQCKRYNSSVGIRAVQEAAAGMDYYHCDAAAVITNNTFTKQAENMAKTTGVRLWDRGFLIKLIQNYDSGYDEIYGQKSFTNTDITHVGTSKVCPSCGREFLSGSVRCPICECDLVSIASSAVKCPQTRKQNLSVSNSRTPVHITIQNSSTVKTTKTQKRKSPSDKQSTLGIIALVLSLTGYLSIIGLILSIVDLRKKDNKKKTCSIIALVIACILPFAAINQIYENTSSKNKFSSTTSYNSDSNSFQESNETQAQDTMNPEESNSISELTFGEENIIDTTIDFMQQYDYIKDVAINVYEDKKAIHIAVQVPSSINEDTAKMAGEDVARYLAFMAGTADSDYKLPGNDDIGGIYDKYDLLIYIDDGFETLEIWGAKVAAAQKITWH